jgi:hypothetical protein
MSNSGDNRSVTARDITGAQIVTGDSNRTVMRNVKVQELPPAGQVDVGKELAELRALLGSLNAPDAGKLDRALADAEEEASKPEPDRVEVGSALDRAVRYAEKASDFSEKAEKIAPKLKALVSWLGANWHKILGAVGMAVI